MYAIIDTGGHQHRVSEGELLRVESLRADVGARVRFTDVLLVGGDEIKVGTPTVDGVTVTAEVVEQTLGPKVTVFKMKRRKGYRVKTGHRQQYTTVRITGIEGN